MTSAQKAAVKAAAVDRGLIPRIEVDPTTKFANFDAFSIADTHLPEHLWLAGDEAQFSHLNDFIGREVEGYTWHHHQDPGRMQLVPFGIHNSTNHVGGRNIWGGGTAAR